LKKEVVRAGYVERERKFRTVPLKREQSLYLFANLSIFIKYHPLYIILTLAHTHFEVLSLSVGKIDLQKVYEQKTWFI